MFDGYASVTVTGKLLKKIVSDYTDLLSDLAGLKAYSKIYTALKTRRKYFCSPPHLGLE